MLITSIGFLCLIYAGYLGIRKKIPYIIEKSIKPECRDDYLKTEIRFFIQTAVVLVLFDWLPFYIDIYNVYLYFGIFAVIYFWVYWQKAKKQREFYY